jgi:hypothetical protein
MTQINHGFSLFKFIQVKASGKANIFSCYKLEVLGNILGCPTYNIPRLASLYITELLNHGRRSLTSLPNHHGYHV